MKLYCAIILLVFVLLTLETTLNNSIWALGLDLTNKLLTSLVLVLKTILRHGFSIVMFYLQMFSSMMG